MSQLTRQFIRFPLDLEARVFDPTGERVDAVINEIGLGGCFFGNAWVESVGSAFRLELRLPNGNWLPLNCVRVHMRGGVGAKFTEMTDFEQNLLGEVIASASRSAGYSNDVDPFAAPNETADIRIRRRVPSAAENASPKDELVTG